MGSRIFCQIFLSNGSSVYRITHLFISKFIGKIGDFVSKIGGFYRKKGFFEGFDRKNEGFEGKLVFWGYF
jgi:hypothetical protein